MRRVLVGAAALITALLVLTGCTKSISGTAVKAGGAGVPRNNNSQERYPNLLKECEVLTTDILAKTVGADPLDIQSTFVGAICRWQAANPAGLIDITRFWFEQGSLSNERKVAEGLKYQVETRAIQGVDSIVMRTGDPNGGLRRRQRRGGSGRLVGQSPGSWYRRLRAGDQADGADAGNQRLALGEAGAWA